MTKQDKNLKKKKKKVASVEEPIKKKKKKKKPPVIEEEPEVQETDAQRIAREQREAAEKRSREDRAFRQLTDMKRRDVQRECILRGCPFEQVTGGSNPWLAGWFTEHLDDAQDNNLLTEFDTWVDGELSKQGYKQGDAMRSPAFKFGIGGNKSEWDPATMARLAKSKEGKKIEDANVEKGQKPKKEKSGTKTKRVLDTKLGIYSGTKKALAYQLTDEGLPINQIIAKVKEIFPDANDKSIQIWQKRRLKENKDK